MPAAASDSQKSSRAARLGPLPTFSVHAAVGRPSVAPLQRRPWQALASTSAVHLPLLGTAGTDWTDDGPALPTPPQPWTTLPPAVHTREERHLRQMAAEVDSLYRRSSPLSSPVRSPTLHESGNPHRSVFMPRPLLLASAATVSPLRSPYLPATPTTPMASPWAPRSGYFDSLASLPPDDALPPPAASQEGLLRPGHVVRPRRASHVTFRGVAQAIGRRVDPAFVAQLLSPKEIVLPVTSKKVVTWSVYLSAIAGFVLLDHYYQLGKHIGDGLRFNNTILMSFIYGTEPALLVLLFCLGRYGPRAQAPSSHLSLAARRARANTNDSALVIPAHNSDPTAFRHMLETALLSFAPQNIFVVDNANCAAPIGETQDIVHDVDADINYMWLPIGNKNAAQYVGSMAVKNAGLRYVLVVDDDVHVPQSFIAPTHLLTGRTKAACFPIEATDSRGKKPLLIGWQDLEYKMAGFTKLAERNACGVLYPHGAVSFWERDTLLEVLRKHDLVFFGEDLKLGLGLMKAQKRLTIDDSQVFATESPETLFGPAPNFYQQRVRSWEMGRHILYKEFFQALFGRNGQRTAHGFAVQKLMQSYAIAINVLDWLRVPLFVAMGAESHFWTKSAIFAASPLVPALLFKYGICRQRPDMAPSLPIALSFPVYKVISGALSVVGAARSLYFYWPNRNKLLTIPEMEKRNDPRCIYLSPHFKQNPGFLAEAELSDTRHVEQFLKTEDLSTELSMAPLTTEGKVQRRSMFLSDAPMAL